MRRSIRFLAVLFTVALVLAACGSDDDLSGLADGGGDSDADAGGDADDEGAGNNPAGFLTEDCDFILDAITSGPTGFDPDADVDETVNFFNELAESAPDEISSDLAIFAEFFDIAAGAFNPDDPSAIDAEALEALSDPAFEEAANNITDFFNENCGAAG